MWSHDTHISDQYKVILSSIIFFFHIHFFHNSKQKTLLHKSCRLSEPKANDKDRKINFLALYRSFLVADQMSWQNRKIGRKLLYFHYRTKFFRRIFFWWKNKMFNFWRLYIFYSLFEFYHLPHFWSYCFILRSVSDVRT